MVVWEGAGFVLLVALALEELDVGKEEDESFSRVFLVSFSTWQRSLVVEAVLLDCAVELGSAGEDPAPYAANEGVPLEFRDPLIVGRGGKGGRVVVVRVEEGVSSEDGRARLFWLVCPLGEAGVEVVEVNVDVEADEGNPGEGGNGEWWEGVGSVYWECYRL